MSQRAGDYPSHTSVFRHWDCSLTPPVCLSQHTRWSPHDLDVLSGDRHDPDLLQARCGHCHGGRTAIDARRCPCGRNCGCGHFAVAMAAAALGRLTLRIFLLRRPRDLLLWAPFR